MAVWKMRELRRGSPDAAVAQRMPLTRLSGFSFSISTEASVCSRSLRSRPLPYCRDAMSFSSGSLGAEMPNLGGCRPGGSEQPALKAQGVAVSRPKQLADYRAAKTRAAKSAMAVFLGAILALGGFYLGWRLGSIPTTSSAPSVPESQQR